MGTKEKQQKFLDALFTDEAKGNIRTAMRIAGYSDSYPTSSLVSTLKDEMVERTRLYIASTSPSAIYSLQKVLTDPNPELLGLKEKIAVAKDLLDRSGYGKVEQVEVTAKSPLFILPEKSKDDE